MTACTSSPFLFLKRLLPEAINLLLSSQRVLLLHREDEGKNIDNVDGEENFLGEEESERC